MTTPETNPEAWYWGALRSALADQDLERAWQLIAAWPSGPDEGAAEGAALSYLFREAEAGGRTRRLADTLWMLDFYRETPVPVFQPGGRWELADEEEDEPGQGWRGDLLLGEGDVQVVLSLRANKDGEPLMWAEAWREDESFDLFGCEHSDLPSPMEGRLLRRLGRVRSALLHSNDPLRLVWDADLRTRLAVEGPSLHPSLLWLPQPADRMEQEPVYLLRERWRGARPEFLGVRTLPDYLTDELRGLIQQAEARLAELGAEPGFGVPQARYIYEWRKREVKRRVQNKAALRIQLERLRIAREAAPELAALQEAIDQHQARMRAASLATRIEARAARLLERAARLADPLQYPALLEEDDDEEDDDEDDLLRAVRRRARRMQARRASENAGSDEDEDDDEDDDED